MKARYTLMAASLAAALSLGFSLPAAAQKGGASTKIMALGLDDSQLVEFDVASPAKTTVVRGFISGLQAPDFSLVGMDFLGSTLYGVGNAGGIYTINPADAVATKVAQLSVALDGDRFSVDIDASKGHLRVISDKGQNLYIDVGQPNLGTVTEPQIAGTNFQLGAGSMVAHAYSNTGGTTTGIGFPYVVAARDSGPFTLAGVLTDNLGFVSLFQALLAYKEGLNHLSYDIRTQYSGTTPVSNRGYLIQAGPLSSSLYTLDPGVGVAKLVGNFPAGMVVTEIAVRQPN